MVISEARKPAYSLEENQSDLIPWYVVGAVALICAAALILISVLGPLVLNTIHYRTTQSGIWQTEGQDLTDLILVTPILVIGGILHLLRRDSSKYFLVLPPITLIYTGLSYGIGQEWSDTSLSGNVMIVAVQLALLAAFSVSPVFGSIVGAVISYPITFVIAMRVVWRVRPFSE